MPKPKTAASQTDCCKMVSGGRGSCRAANVIRFAARQEPRAPIQSTSIWHAQRFAAACESISSRVDGAVLRGVETAGLHHRSLLHVDPVRSDITKHSVQSGPLWDALRTHQFVPHQIEGKSRPTKSSRPASTSLLLSKTTTWRTPSLPVKATRASSRRKSNRLAAQFSLGLLGGRR
jgi:hypothetical protein